MNKRIATALVLAGSAMFGPAATAASAEQASTSGYQAQQVREGVLDHGQEKPAEDGGDHDHDGDGKPDHDPEDHGHDDHDDKDDAPKPKPKG